MIAALTRAADAQSVMVQAPQHHQIVSMSLAEIQPFRIHKDVIGPLLSALRPLLLLVALSLSL